MRQNGGRYLTIGAPVEMQRRAVSGPYAGDFGRGADAGRAVPGPHTGGASRMTKKDYELLAWWLRGEKPAPYHQVYWAHLVKSLADTLKAENPRFIKAKFYRACGYDG